MKRKHKEEFEKNGYLELMYDNNKKVFRLKRNPGRPKSKNRKDIKKVFRIDSKLQQILEDYCRTNKVKESEAIREAIRKLKIID